jgi:chemotaxis protein methyltransferase CheR
VRSAVPPRASTARGSLAATEKVRPSVVAAGGVPLVDRGTGRLASLSPRRPSVVATGFPAAGSSTGAHLDPMREQALGSLREWVQVQLGMSFHGDQRALFVDRTEALCRELSITPEVLLSKLRGGDHALGLRVAERLSTNYTFFRREPEMFEYLRGTILPQLPAGPLRFWSAAASSGDEAYSLAITSFEYWGPDAGQRVRILGTDISDRQVAMAERGLYPREQLSTLDRARLDRWFTPAPRGQMKVDASLIKMCTFRRLNLAQQSWPFTQRFHLIFLRNVLYYFDQPTRLELLDRCYEAAEPGAYLITSLTEPMLEPTTRWRSVRTAVFRKDAR